MGICAGLMSEVTSSRSVSEGSLALSSESLTSSTLGFIVNAVVVVFVGELYYFVFSIEHVSRAPHEASQLS